MREKAEADVTHWGYRFLAKVRTKFPLSDPLLGRTRGGVAADSRHVACCGCA